MKFSGILTAAGLAALLGSAATAAPTGDQIDFDVQCVAALEQTKDKVPEELRSKFEAGLTYYFGRIDAAVPVAELQERLEAGGKALEGKLLAPVVEQCGRFMVERGAVWMEISKRIQAREDAAAIH